MKTTTIGRSSSCDIVIADEGISRIHAEISLAGGQYAFKDVSKNGSTINGSYINNSKVVVAPGTNILLANRIPLPWAQIYAQLPLQGVRPYEKETCVQPMGPDNGQGGYAPVNSYDRLAVGWGFLAFFFPIVGFILYFCWRARTPRRASSIATWAWIGFGVTVFLNFISLMFI